MSSRRRSGWWLAGFIGLLIGAVAWALTQGHAEITVARLATAAWRNVCLPSGLDCPQQVLTPIEQAIVWQSRAPRVVAAAAVGAGLAIAGTVMQALVRNPLADPYLLGVSSGASVGAVVVLVVGVAVVLPVAAFVGGMAALGLTLLLAGTRGGDLPPARTVLAGVAVAQGAAAVLSLIIFTSATGDSYREILTWLLGSLAGVSWPQALLVTASAVVVGLVLATQARALDVMLLGDTAALAAGVNVRLLRWLLLTVIAVLVGGLVAVSGAIGFVGLIVPHAVRLLVGARHGRVLSVSAVAGALFLVLADTVARSAFAPRELPVGILTAAIGAPVFALLLRRSRA